MFGRNSVQTGKHHVQKLGEYGQFLLEKGNCFSWKLLETVSFLAVYKIIVCKIKRNTTFSVFGRSVLLPEN